MADVVRSVLQAVKDVTEKLTTAPEERQNVKPSDAKDSDVADQRAYPAGMSEQSEEQTPGREAATLPLTSNAGVETQGADADEKAAAAKATTGTTAATGAASPAADDGDTAEGAAAGDDAAATAPAALEEAPSKVDIPGVTSPGEVVGIGGQLAGLSSDEEPMSTSEDDQAKAANTFNEDAANTVKEAAAKASSEGEPMNTSADDTIGAGTMGGSGGQAAGMDPSALPDMQKNEEVLHEQEQAGKIFQVEPVLPGGGVTVHGMVPASILMHSAENTKRTGGSYKAAVEGVPDPEEGQAYALEDKTGILEQQGVPGAPITAADLAEPEVAAPDSNTTA